jgi:hypothetical protein
MSELARALVPIAHRALALPASRSSEDAPLLAGALDAIDGFLAEPVASRYLRAARALAELTRLRRRTTELEKLARRSLSIELGRLESMLPVDDDAATSAAAELQALPPDPRAGLRVRALVALLEAHAELAVRVRAPERHRARMALPAPGAGRPGAGPALQTRGADRRGERIARKRRA